MTDNEIIKAIDKCLRADDCHTSECPFFDGSKDGWDCQLVALSLARDLINRQKAEIERLKLECGNAKFAKYKAEFEEFRAEIKAEAIKEFAERLEPRLANNTDISAVGYQSIIADIRNLVKEMVGDNNV